MVGVGGGGAYQHEAAGFGEDAGVGEVARVGEDTGVGEDTEDLMGAAELARG
jgi:hypothetical protein